MTKNIELDPKTPHWFKDWHTKYFVRVDDRTKRNERWIYIIITAIIASGIMANGHTEEVIGFLKSIIEAIF